MKLQFNPERTKLTITATRADRDRLKRFGEKIHQDKTMLRQLEHVLAANPGLDYQVRSVLEDLRDKGKAVFIGGN